ncbi:MAG: hypothetical protein Q9217_003731 [Psora testacea]
MSSTESPEARELNLVSKVELKIALTQNETALQKLLATYLPPLLLKLESEFGNVRNKVISLCQHINTRTKLPSIQLPVAALLEQYKEQHNPLIRHFDLLYIQQGVDRLHISDRLNLIPAILHGLHANYEESAKHAASLFNVFLRLLHSMTLPSRGTEDDLNLRNKLRLTDKDNDATFAAEWIGKLLLYGKTQPGATPAPGLSTDDCNFLEQFGKTDLWSPGAPRWMSLVETKVVAARFLASGAFTDAERFLPALFASVDPNSRISDIGDDILKRATSAVSFEDPELVKRLFSLYLGTRGTTGSLPARPPLQIKILALLCRSKFASSLIAQSTQVVREGLAPQETLQHNGSTPTPKKGLEATKLRGQVFAFTSWLARTSSPADMASLAPTLVAELRKYIDDQGWPRPRTDEPLSAGELSSRAYGYESIGLLAAACPVELLLEPNLELLRWLFTSLSEDPSCGEISISIEHALAAVLGSFAGRTDADLETSLASLFLHHMELTANTSQEDRNDIVRSTRFVAVRFANRCLPYTSIDGRYIDVLALCGHSGERNEVLEEAKKGLDPYWHRVLNPQINSPSIGITSNPAENIQFPAFPPLAERLFGSKAGWDLSNAHLVRAYMTALSFCRCTLLHQALTFVGSPPIVDTEWERNIDALVANNEDARGKLPSFFLKQLEHVVGFSRALQMYLQACFRGLVDLKHGDLSRSGDYLRELCIFLPSLAYINISRNITKLQGPILSSSKSLRENASNVFGLLASSRECPEAAVSDMLKAFDQRLQSWQQAIGSQVLQVHGAILAKTYFLSRLVRRGNPSDNFDDVRSTFQAVCFAILNDGRDKLLLDGVFITVSELALYGVLTSTTMSASQTQTVVQKLAERGKEGNEKAIKALGHLAMQWGEDDSDGCMLGCIIHHLYDLHTVRQPEVQFAIGEALSCAAIGWDSKALVSALDISGPPPKSAPRAKTLSTILDRLLADCRTTKPALRQATVIWLLCLVQFCGGHAELQSRLRECQVAFKGFLADRESLNQESASRGLTLVYEKGDRALKDNLIRDLVGSFTGSRSGLAGNVSEDTELFDVGALPTGDGSITTYKDIISLASEVGDSSLVYRFLSLASHDAIWSSRAAFGRFGLSNILSDASTDGYLAQNPKLYPALFRYRFDPNPNVRSAMNEIWTALVKDSAATINTHFDSIIKDLFKSILGKEWRTRQASCAAIADLVQGRPLETYEMYLNEIWSLTFKVCDDIKESVRNAAMALARVLTGILTRALEAGDSSARTADKMLKQVLPFLLSTQGLESSAPEVQDFSRKTILQIIKKSNGKTLRPFVPKLVGRLLALLSSIEPEMINYLHLNAEAFGVTKEELDDARLKHIRGSSMLESIDRCLDYLDDSAMSELQHHLENAIKTVIGLPSKVGCTRVLVSLSTRQNFIFKSYADQFLTLAQKQVFDRNDTISSAYAVACGYLARVASDDTLQKMIDGCRKLYSDSDEDRQRVISGNIVYAFSKHATDRFNSFAGEALPLVFVAKHDQLDRAKKLFEDTWNENVGGSRAVLLYLKEIVQLALQYLDSTRWPVKHSSAFAIADVVMSAGSHISDVDATLIWPALEKALAGKTWEGKEKALKAFIQFARNSNILKTDRKMAEHMEMIMIRESKRNNAAYRQHAFECLADFVDLLEGADMYEQVYGVTQPTIEALSGEAEDMDIDSSSGGPSTKTVKNLTLANALTAQLRSIDPNKKCLDGLLSCLTRSLKLVNKVIGSEAGSKSLRIAVYDALIALFQRLQKLDVEVLPRDLDDTLSEYLILVFSAGDQVEHVRVKAAEAAMAMAPLARGGSRLRATFADGLTNARSQERSNTVQQSLDRARLLLEG